MGFGPEMRLTLRGVAILLRYSFRAAPRQTVLLFVSQLFWAGASLAGPYSIKLIADAAVTGSRREVLVAGALIASSFAVLRLTGRIYVDLVKEIEERATVLIDRHLMALFAGIPGVEHHERPDLLDELQVFRDEKVLLAQLTNALILNFRSNALLVGTALLLASISPWLLGIVLLSGGSIIFTRKAQQFSQRSQTEAAADARLRMDLFTLGTSAQAGKELRVFALGDELICRQANASENCRRIWERAYLYDMACQLCAALLSSACFIGAIAFVLVAAFNGHASAGDVLLTATLAATLNAVVAGVVQYAGYLFGALKTAGRFVSLIDYAASRSGPIDPEPVPIRLESGIALNHVSFRYPGTERLILDDVSLTLERGSVVAFVGENGAGKTTLIKLLCGFYEPESGAIEVDGVDLRRFGPDEWRQQTTASFQDFCKFEFSAGETVGVGDLPEIASPVAVGAALDRAAASDVLAALPQGLETQLGNVWWDGVELSGGQWQKLALARALMRPAPLLTIFDEPTATLDPPTEHSLFSRFAEAARSESRSGAVTLLVSHRFSTVRMADTIIVLESGRVLESGSHAELIGRDGLYAELYELQARAYRPTPG